MDVVTGVSPCVDSMASADSPSPSHPRHVPRRAGHRDSGESLHRPSVLARTGSSFSAAPTASTTTLASTPTLASSNTSVSSAGPSRAGSGPARRKTSKQTRASIVTGFFTVKEPSTKAFEEYRKEQARRAAAAADKTRSSSALAHGDDSKSSGRWLGLAPAPRGRGSHDRERSGKASSVFRLRSHPSTSTVNSHGGPSSTTSSNGSHERLGLKVTFAGERQCSVSDPAESRSLMAVKTPSTTSLPTFLTLTSDDPLAVDETAAAAAATACPETGPAVDSLPGSGGPGRGRHAAPPARTLATALATTASTKTRDRDITPWDFAEPPTGGKAVMSGARADGWKQARRPKLWPQSK